MFLLRYLRIKILKRIIFLSKVNNQNNYECGYGLLMKYSYTYIYQFYLISISFMIFDLEIILYLPVIYSFRIFYMIYIFLKLFFFFITIGLLWEILYLII